ncbi:MAG TPA: transposase [Candidatus Anaerobiospirillum pullistercoris]|uniref:Transposase n=1 Tax=Candidatus Anaerobiospirillum pullistercoris TaxID=2838452 RepID=A0A9D1WCX2_9GAMM|nr:transposase [Candidatus Anaerobiospirillum pullistercoris]
MLYQNVDAILALLYESAPILDSWAKAQVKAQQLTNPKGAGRKPANPVLMFLILLVRSFLGLSNTKLARVLVSDLSVQQFVSEQLDWLAGQQRMERLEQLHFPKLSTIRKYIELLAHDGILAECKAKATKFFVTYGAAFFRASAKRCLLYVQYF